LHATVQQRCLLLSMGAAHSRGANDIPDGEERQNNRPGIFRNNPLRRRREDRNENDGEEQEHTESRARRRRLAPGLGSSSEQEDTRGNPFLDTLARVESQFQQGGIPHNPHPPSTMDRHSPSNSGTTHAAEQDPLAEERQHAMNLIERTLRETASPHPPLDPTRLPGTYGRRHFPVMPALRRAALFGQRPRPASTFGSLLSDVLGAQSGQTSGHAPLSGTSVIVQGALVARTSPSGQTMGQAPSSSSQDERTATDGSLQGNHSSDSSSSNASSSQSTTTSSHTHNTTQSQIPQTATIEEQSEMLGRILRIAAAATAASVVGASTMPSAATTTDAAPQDTNSSSSETQHSPEVSQSSARESRLGRDLLERLLPHRQGSSTSQSTMPESEAISMISRLMREALRASLSARGDPQSSSESSRTTPSESVQATLDQARAGLPLTPGEPGSFDRFLHDLLEDLSAALHRLGEENDPERPSPAREADAEQSNRQDGDVVCGQLSFFRLFRFDRHEPTSLIPCILVGVRSLRADERLMGEVAPQTDDNGRGISRLVMFVSGGRYHDEHPLLTAHPREAGRDLMFMMELLGTMSAMQNKRPTASANDIERSGLKKVRGTELPALLEQGAITENTSEKCLVCLEEWQDDSECRVLSCKHVFHTSCIDHWLENSSNTCPLCMYILRLTSGRSEAVSLSH